MTRLAKGLWALRADSVASPATAGQTPTLGIQAFDLSNLGQRIQPGWLMDYLIHPPGIVLAP